MKKIALLFFIALIFRLPGLNRPIIFDEPKAFECIAGSFGTIAAKLLGSSQPPLYYYVLKVWSLFCADPIFLRFLMVLLGASICVVLYKTAEIVFTREAAYYTFIFAALSPQLIFQSQYLRPYCMATLFSAILIYLFMRFKGDVGKRAALYYFGIFTILTVLSLYTFYYSILVVLALNVGALYFLRKDRAKLFLWLASQIAAALSYSSWLPFLLVQNFLISSGVTCHLSEIENARIGFYVGKIHVGNIARAVLAYCHFDDVLGQAKRYSEYTGYRWLFISGALAVMISIVYYIPRFIKTIFRTERIKDASLLLLLLVIIPVVTVTIFSIGGDLGLWSRAVVNIKYFTQSSIYVLILFSMLLVSMKKGLLRRALFSCVIIFFLALDLNIYRFPSNIYKPAISYLDDKSRDCRVVVLGPPTALNFFNTLSDRRFSDYRILEYSDSNKYAEKFRRDIGGTDKFYFYYLKSAENMVIHPDIDSKFERLAGSMGFIKRDEKKISDVLIISYFERDR